MSRSAASTPAESAALDHLARTRERLREALPASHSSPARPAPVGSSAPADGSNAAPTAADNLRLALSQAWQGHPVHQGTALAASLARLALQGAAERNPLGLVVGAGVVGMVLARSQPWRFLIKPAMRTGWPIRLALGVLTQVPLHRWAAVLAANPARKARP